MQPDHFGAECNSLGEQLGIRCQWNVQTGPNEIGLEARRECRMCHYGGEVGHHILGFDWLRIDIRQVPQQSRLDVRLRRVHGRAKADARGHQTTLVVIRSGIKPVNVIAGPEVGE